MFGPFGVPRGSDTWGLSRNAADRHRRIWLAITLCNLLIKSHRLPDFGAEAPQRCTVRLLAGRSATAELRADTQPDHLITIEGIALPDDSFERTICNHGPEQVDDQRALAEVYRVPLPGGARRIQLDFADPAYPTGKLVTIFATLLAVAASAAGIVLERRPRAA